MALKLAGEEIGIQEKIETISYNPGAKDTGDLEPATKTISATSEATGVDNADYSKALTLPKPDDARLVVKIIAARLAVTIDSFDTATHLYCRVYVDVQDADHLLFDEDWDSIGAKLDAVDTRAGVKETIFNLLKDGAAHTFYFFFRVNQANNAVISVVQLWEGVGSCYTNTYTRRILDINHCGLISLFIAVRKAGTGSCGWRIVFPDTDLYLLTGSTDGRSECMLINNASLSCGGSVSTDLNYLSKIYLHLRSEQ